LCHNSEKHSFYARHAGLDPASRIIARQKLNGFRISSGMTTERISFQRKNHGAADRLNPGALAVAPVGF
jgi:hypothetical protein